MTALEVMVIYFIPGMRPLMTVVIFVHIMLMVVGFFHEGVRPHMFPLYLASVISYPILFLFSGPNIDAIALCILFVGWVMYTGLALKYGICDLAGADPTGPFEVAYSNKYSTESGNFCTIFYPTDEKNKDDMPHGYIEGKDQLKSIYDAIKWMTPDDPVPLHFILKTFMRATVKVAANARVAKEFSSENKLPVVVFSHGYTMSSRHYSLICREIASYGCCVIALDHHDGSCGYTVNQKTKEQVLFDTEIESHEKPKWLKKVTHRVGEVEAIIDDLDRVGELVFADSGRLDKERVGVVGHSFGGVTTVQTLM